MVGYGDEGWGQRSGEADVLSELRRISRELRALNQTVNAAVRPDARAEGSDASGSIGIVVDGRHRVQSVDVDPAWPERLDAADLGHALLEAYGGAVAQLFVAASTAIDEAAEELDEAALRRAADDALESRWRRPVAPEEILDDVQEQLRRIEMMQRLDASPAGHDTAPPAGRDQAVFGPGRFVEITLRAGQIAEIRVHLSRMPRDANRALAREALGAFTAAAEAAAASAAPA